MSKVDEQIQLELLSVDRGVKRFYESLRTDEAKGREYEGVVGSRLINRLMAEFIPAVKDLQREAAKKKRGALTTGRRLSGWEDSVRALTKEEIAYIVVRSVLQHKADRESYDWVRLAYHVGGRLNEQLWFNELRRLERSRLKTADPNPPYNRVSMLKREVKKINPRVVRKWATRLGDLECERWSKDEKTKLGLVLLDALIGTCTSTFERHTVWENAGGGAPRAKVYVRLTDDAHRRLNEEYEKHAAEQPWLMPMVSTPKPWVSNWQGGYLRFRLPFIKDKGWRMLGDSAASAEVYAAINRIQEVAWAINEPVRQVLEVARKRELGVVRDGVPIAPPARMPDDVWQAMSKEEKAALRLRRRSIHDHNNRLASRGSSLNRQLQVAHDLKDQPAIYFPHCVDFRGRAYPMSQDLHPQADDVGKGLLRFAERKQLGSSGLIWLLRHLANTYGEDKLRHEAQAQWALGLQDWIMTVAEDPLGVGYEFWSQAEEPWQFLAAAIELNEAMKLDHPAEYWSALPIHVDGSCNGLQHLSAMGLDAVGAHAVNLTRDPERQDIYGIVAEKVHAMVEDHVWGRHGGEPSRHHDLAAAWSGKVTRKTVKRGVMTTPYGLTRAGMRDQLIADRHVNDLEGDPGKNASYLRDRMEEALEDTAEKAKGIMTWLQDNATILTEAGIPVEWRTPSGFKVHQGYYKFAPSTFTIMGLGRPTRSVQLQKPDAAQGLAPTKQKLAVAPNVIHSFDAAHMALTVNALSPDIAVAVVHDSYGCHACDMDELLDTIKFTFMDIYSENWLALLQEDFEACAAQVEGTRLLPPPARGNFDIEEVGMAEYFFS